MKTLFKILLFSFIFLISLLCLGFFALNWYGSKVIHENSSGVSPTGMEYQSSIEARLLPSPYFLATNISLVNPKHATKKLATLDSFELRFSWLPLLSNELIVDAFVVKGLSIYIDKDKDGNNNWDVAINNRQGEKQIMMNNPSVSQNVQKAQGLNKFLIKDLRFENIKVYYRDAKVNVMKRIIIDDLSINNLNEKVTVFNLKAKLNDFIFAIHSKVALSIADKNVDFTDLGINLQNNMLKGSGTILFKEAPYGEFNLKADKVDLDSIMTNLSSVMSHPETSAKDENVTPVKKGNQINLIQLAMASLSTKVDFGINQVTYQKKSFEKVNYSIYLKNGSVQYVPCMPLWIKEFYTYLNSMNIQLIDNEKAPKSETWCQ